jgi:CSLREA domain-containing protein
MNAMPRIFARLSASLALISVGVLAGANAANAASFTVDSTVDAPLANPSGTACSSTHEGACTLRAAVQAAGNNSGPSTITLPAGAYDLTIAPTLEEIDPESGDLNVKTETSLTIRGAGAEATFIGATVETRLLRVDYGANVTLVGVDLTGGQSGAGGAIVNEGALTIRQSALVENSATTGSGFGGAIDSTPAATSTTIEGSTLEKNTGVDGGVLRADGGTVSLLGDRMVDNTATAYGGVLAEDIEGPRTTVIERSTLTGNKAALDGGALSLGAGESSGQYGQLTILDSTFEENTAEEGGAIFESRGDEEVTITRSTFDHDTATPGYGGAIFESETPSTHIVESTFEHDSARLGGALYSATSDPHVSRSTFAENTATESGGAAFLADYAGSEPSITTSKFAGNEAHYGGAIYRQEGELDLSASTLVDNNATLAGGGVYFTTEEPGLLVNDTLQGNDALPEGGALYIKPEVEPYVTLLNDTIARNTSESGGGIARPQGIVSVTNTIVALNSGGDCFESTGEEADHGGNIDGDGTCFHRPPTGNHTEVTEEELKLGTLGEYGGLTETIPLDAGSPAIKDGIATCALTDERGVARPSEKCDSGAYEVGPYTQPPLPSVEGASAEPQSGAATVSAKVNPNGVEVTSCEIEYGLEGGFEYAVPCSPGPGSGSAAVTVEGSLGELIAGAKYQYRIVVINTNGVTDGPTSTFTVASQTTTTTTTTSSSSTATTTTTSTATSPPASKASPVKPCVSRRVEPIVWRVPVGAHLKTIVVTVAGKRYRTLRAGARSLRVSLAGLPKGTVIVKITGVGKGSTRYTHSFTFHTCRHGKGGAASPGVPYLRAS